MKTATWTLGMPYWDGIWDMNREDTFCSSDSVWEDVKVYCDIQSHETVAMWEGDDAFGGAGDEYSWAAYIWSEAGEGRMVSTCDDLWWCLDDTLWGPMYWSHFHADGREMTVAEDRASRGCPVDDEAYAVAMTRVSLMLQEMRRPSA